MRLDIKKKEMSIFIYRCKIDEDAEQILMRNEKNNSEWNFLEDKN